MTPEEIVVAIPAPTSSRRGKPELAENQAPGQQRVHQRAGKPRPQAPHRPLQGGDEGTQDDVAEKRQDRPLQRPKVQPGLRGQLSFLAERQKNRLAVPQHRPDRHGDGDGAPQALADGAAHVAHGGSPLADFLRHHWGNSGDQPDAEDQEGEVEIGAERAGSERRGTKPAQHHHIDGRRCGLSQIGEHQRPGKRQGRARLRAP
jgi:hypothetical protein